MKKSGLKRLTVPYLFSYFRYNSRKWTSPKCLLVLGCLVGVSLTGLGQSGVITPEIAYELNRVDNDQGGLVHFYQKLAELEAGDRKKINIVHIGDSHIQADYFSGRIRLELQKQFGNAGRGLVFPYRVAKTNSPEDIKTYSNVSWEAKRNVYPAQPLPIGISGITIRTTNEAFSLKVCIEDKEEEMDYSFDRITFFSDMGKDVFDYSITANGFNVGKDSYTSQTVYHTVRSGESLGVIAQRYGCSVRSIMTWNNLRSTVIYPKQKISIRKKIKEKPKDIPVNQKYEYARIHNYEGEAMVHSLVLDTLIHEFYINGLKQHSTQRQATLYGMVLENEEASGILYHMIGVNGAKFEHYNKSEHFMSQLAYLKPDLIIISLGTNESLGSEFKKTPFYNQMNTFTSDLMEIAPETDVIFTTPAENLKRRRYVNRNASVARDVVISHALNEGYAFWDLYGIIGGDGAMATWVRADLAQRDHIHFTKMGYDLQGRLFSEALINGYARYKQVGAE